MTDNTTIIHSQGQMVVKETEEEVRGMITAPKEHNMGFIKVHDVSDSSGMVPSDHLKQGYNPVVKHLAIHHIVTYFERGQRR